MANATIKITQLPNIGNALAANTILPVVNTTGTAVTDKTTLGNIANFTLNQAGNTLPPAFLSSLAYSVANAAQPNITSVGTLNINTLHISGGTNGQYLQTDGTGNLSWAVGGSGGNGSPGGSNTQVQFNANGLFAGTANFTYDTTRSMLTVANLSSPSNANMYISASNGGPTWLFGKGGALVWPGNASHAIESNIDDEFEIHSDNNVVISTDAANSNSHFTFDSLGIFTAPSNVNLLGSRLNIGADSPNISLSNPTLVIANNSPVYIQTAQFNTNAQGSSDYAAYGADSDESGGWVDMGFTGHGFNDANYTSTNPGDGYLFAQGYANGVGGSLVLATGAEGNVKDIVFTTGGFLTENIVARFSYANAKLEMVNAGIAYVGASPSPSITGFNSVQVGGYIKTTPVAASALPTASTAGSGARAFVTDATSVTFAAALTGGGGNIVPVWSNGTGWFIG